MKILVIFINIRSRKLFLAHYMYILDILLCTFSTFLHLLYRHEGTTIFWVMTSKIFER